MTTFQQDGAPPYIGHCMEWLLRQYFTEDHIIGRTFPTSCPPSSLHTNPYDLWLWDYLKCRVYQGDVQNLTDLKNVIILHTRNITNDQLCAAVEHAVTRYHLLLLQHSGHTEQSF